MGTEIVRYIRTHYDPDGLTTPHEDPGNVLQIFRECFPDEPCALTLADVREYINALSVETAEEHA